MPNILVVDDSPVDRQLFSKILEKLDDVTLIPAENGVEALEKIEPWSIDLVVTDLQMPEMDGLQLVKTLREDFPDIPTVLVTGVGSEEIAAQALIAGASSYLPKQKASELLLPTVEGVLEVMFAEHSFARLLGKTTETRFDFEFENDATYFPIVLELADRMLEGLSGLDRIHRLRIAVAVDHALQNAMYRGNLEMESSQSIHDRRPDRRKQFTEKVAQRQAKYSKRLIHVRLSIEPGNFTCIVRDDGPGFEPVVPSGLDGHSGRGLVIMHTFMDQVQYNRLGNKVMLRKTWQTADATTEELADSPDLLLTTQEMTLGVLTAIDFNYSLELIEPILLVGSASTCHVVLRDAKVQPEHCRFVYKDGIWSFSAIHNQTIQLNGSDATQGKILPGDLLGIGQHVYQIKYEVPDD